MLYEECYRWAIKACIRSRKRKYLDKAIHLLDELRTQPIAVSVSTFNLVLYGLANCEPCEENARRGAPNALEKQPERDVIIGQIGVIRLFLTTPPSPGRLAPAPIDRSSAMINPPLHSRWYVS